MNNPISQDYSSLIERVEDRSSHAMSRIRVFFKNGYELSIIRGECSFGGEKGLFEIMPSHSEIADVDVFDEDSGGDTVLGYLDVATVNYYIGKIGNLPHPLRGNK